MQKFLTVHVMLKGGQGEESISLACLRHWLQVTPIPSLFQHPSLRPPLPPPPSLCPPWPLPVLPPVHSTTLTLSLQNKLYMLSCLVNMGHVSSQHGMSFASSAMFGQCPVQ